MDILITIGEYMNIRDVTKFLQCCKQYSKVLTGAILWNVILIRDYNSNGTIAEYKRLYWKEHIDPIGFKREMINMLIDKKYDKSVTYYVKIRYLNVPITVSKGRLSFSCLRTVVKDNRIVHDSRSSLYCFVELLSCILSELRLKDIITYNKDIFLSSLRAIYAI